VVVLDGCTFTAPPGELTALVGPAGMTTLINLIAGYEPLTTRSTIRCRAHARPTSWPVQRSSKPSKPC
jgi:ABC-type multidrug transport system ATPase subunit